MHCGELVRLAIIGRCCTYTILGLVAVYLQHIEYSLYSVSNITSHYPEKYIERMLSPIFYGVFTTLVYLAINYVICTKNHVVRIVFYNALVFISTFFWNASLAIAINEDATLYKFFSIMYCVTTTVYILCVAYTTGFKRLVFRVLFLNCISVMIHVKFDESIFMGVLEVNNMIFMLQYKKILRNFRTSIVHTSAAEILPVHLCKV